MHVKALFIGSALLLSSVAATEAHAYEPTDQKTRNLVGEAITACKHALKTENPGLVAADNYHRYQSKLAEAKSRDPKVMQWDVRFSVAGVVPSEFLPKCEKIFADYAAGVNADATPVGDGCKRNVFFRLDPIIEKYYPKFKEQGTEGLTVWHHRKDLEAARYYMSGNDQTKGYPTQGAGCAPNDRFKSDFKPISAKFKQAEKIVKEMEKAKNIKFKAVEDHHIIFIDLATGKPVAKSDAY